MGDLSARSAAAGFWSGRTATDGWADLIILENGSTWGVLADAVQITGALQGDSAISHGRFSATLSEYNFADATAPLVAYRGAATPRSHIDTEADGARRLILNYDPAYEQTASTQTLAGRYALDGSTELAINSRGEFNWIASSDCVLTGHAAPRPSGRNVFNLSLTYMGQSCPHPNAARVSGVAYLDVKASPPRLVSLALLDDGTVGFVSRAVKLQDGAAPAPAPAPGPTPTPTPAEPPGAPAPLPLPPIDGGGGGGGGGDRDDDDDDDDDDD